MSEEARMDWRMPLRHLNQAIRLARGVDRHSGSRWWLFGLPGNVYYTIELPLTGRVEPFIVPCDYASAVVLFDDAVHRDSPSLDVKRALKALRRDL